MMTSPSMDREVCLHKIFFSEFSPVPPITKLFISVYNVLSFHSDVISLSIGKIFESRLCFYLMITGNDCTNRHKNLRAPVILAMTDAGP